MAANALLIRFGRPTTAREPQALELFDTAMSFYSRQQEQGRVDSVESVLVQPHATDLAGFFLIRGDREQLDALRDDEEFRRINARASLVVDDFGVVPAFVGQSQAEEVDVFRSEVEAQLRSS